MFPSKREAPAWPAVQAFAKAIQLARRNGTSEEEIELALEIFEGDNAELYSPDVLAVVIGELRRSIGK